VRVHVDEPGREHEPAGVDDPVRGGVADRRDPALDHQDVPRDPGRAGAVDDLGPPEQHRHQK